ncbi:uncharacterized protein WM294_009596 isoform 2-T2 [Sarcoramphus papa]
MIQFRGYLLGGTQGCSWQGHYWKSLITDLIFKADGKVKAVLALFHRCLEDLKKSCMWAHGPDEAEAACRHNNPPLGQLDEDITHQASAISRWHISSFEFQEM